MNNDKGRPRIGLALGGGGARGYAHVGVIKALLEAGIPIDIIAGTSMGAVVGAAYAAGCGVDEMEGLVSKMRWKRMAGLVDLVIPYQGVINGTRLEKFFSVLTGGKEFGQLEKPLIVVATDIPSGEEVRINSGSVATALRASTAVPGIFCPVTTIEPYVLVDGSVSTPVPVKALREAGAEVIIAIDVCSPVDRAELLMQVLKWWKEVPSAKAQRIIDNQNLVRFPKPSLPASVKIVDRSLELNNQYKKFLSDEEPHPNNCVLVKPEVEDVRWFEFYKAAKCIQTGESAGRQAIDKIKALLKQRDVNWLTKSSLLNIV